MKKLKLFGIDIVFDKRCPADVWYLMSKKKADELRKTRGKQSQEWEERKKES